MSKRTNGTDNGPNLGPCCVCWKYQRERNILTLNGLCPTPGKGWGCVVCSLPSDGAMAVVCDKCMQDDDVFDSLEYICTGYPGTDGRTPIGEMRGQHNHDMSKHPEEGTLIV